MRHANVTISILLRLVASKAFANLISLVHDLLITTEPKRDPCMELIEQILSMKRRPLYGVN